MLIIFTIPLLAQNRVESYDDLVHNPNINLTTPIILSNKILFYYKGSATNIVLSGEFNNWADDLNMVQASEGLWVATWEQRLTNGLYPYRLRVDGFWIADPQNPNFRYDQGGVQLSLLNITNTFEPNRKFPYWISNNTYKFQHYNTNARSVTIAGDFNNWNPYSHPMVYVGAGFFEIELELTPKKTYIYSFVQDGEWTFDENNRQQFRNKLNRPVSAFYADLTNSRP